MIDPSCLEDICGDPKVLLKPRRTYCLGGDGRYVGNIVQGLGNQSRSRARVSLYITHENAERLKVTGDVKPVRFTGRGC